MLWPAVAAAAISPSVQPASCRRHPAALDAVACGSGSGKLTNCPAGELSPPPGGPGCVSADSHTAGCCGGGCVFAGCPGNTVPASPGGTAVLLTYPPNSGAEPYSVGVAYTLYTLPLGGGGGRYTLLSAAMAGYPSGGGGGGAVPYWLGEAPAGDWMVPSCCSGCCCCCCCCNFCSFRSCFHVASPANPTMSCTHARHAHAHMRPMIARRLPSLGSARWSRNSCKGAAHGEWLGPSLVSGMWVDRRAYGMRHHVFGHQLESSCQLTFRKRRLYKLWLPTPVIPPCALAAPGKR